MVSLAVLLSGLGLSAYNLLLMTSEVGTLTGLQQSWQILMHNYGSRRGPATEPVPAVSAATEPSVRLLYSVTGGESVVPGLQEKIADPIVDYHRLAGTALDAVLIERKLPLSKFVRVRLFFTDKSESEFLWPYGGADDDWWVPTCTLAEPTADEPLCPPAFLEAYPRIKALMKIKK